MDTVQFSSLRLYVLFKVSNESVAKSLVDQRSPANAMEITQKKLYILDHDAHGRHRIINITGPIPRIGAGSFSQLVRNSALLLFRDYILQHLI